LPWLLLLPLGSASLQQRQIHVGTARTHLSCRERSLSSHAGWLHLLLISNVEAWRQRSSKLHAGVEIKEGSSAQEAQQNRLCRRSRVRRRVCVPSWSLSRNSQVQVATAQFACQRQVCNLNGLWQPRSRRQIAPSRQGGAARPSRASQAGRLSELVVQPGRDSGCQAALPVATCRTTAGRRCQWSSAPAVQWQLALLALSHRP
jgi:hypothetical protein